MNYKVSVLDGVKWVDHQQSHTQQNLLEKSYPTKLQNPQKSTEASCWDFGSHPCIASSISFFPEQNFTVQNARAPGGRDNFKKKGDPKKTMTKRFKTSF